MQRPRGARRRGARARRGGRRTGARTATQIEFYMPYVPTQPPVPVVDYDLASIGGPVFSFTGAGGIICIDGLTLSVPGDCYFMGSYYSGCSADARYNAYYDGRNS